MDEATPGRMPAIDDLWGALESDDDLISADETVLIDARLAALREEGTECIQWERVRAYITSRPTTRTKSA